MRRRTRRLLLNWTFAADAGFLLAVLADGLWIDAAGLWLWLPAYLVLMAWHAVLLLTRGVQDPVWVVQSVPPEGGARPRTVIPRGRT